MTRPIKNKDKFLDALTSQGLCPRNPVSCSTYILQFLELVLHFSRNASVPDSLQVFQISISPNAVFSCELVKGILSRVFFYDFTVFFQISLSHQSPDLAFLE